VVPIRRLARYAGALGDPARPEPLPPAGPPEVRDLTAAMNLLVERIEAMRSGSGPGSPTCRTGCVAHDRAAAARDAVADRERARLAADLDELQATVDHVVREARRSEREGLVARTDAVAVVSERARFWAPLAEDLGRPFEVHVGPAGPVPTRMSAEDLHALVDVLLDNVFPHTADAAPVTVTLAERAGGGLVLTVDDGGPGFLPVDLDVTGRGASGSGGTGLGLAIVRKTATESGGGLALGVSPLGGGRVVVELGPPARPGAQDDSVRVTVAGPPTRLRVTLKVSLPALSGRRTARKSASWWPSSRTARAVRLAITLPSWRTTSFHVDPAGTPSRSASTS
jgi:signal transduction histidine kinase